MKIVCIIPARGGSERIQNKNIVPLAGKPLIAYTIEQAKSSKMVSRVIVSTDDDKIAKVSKEYGAEVIMRPSELATATSPSEDALFHVLGYLKERSETPDLIVFLQCTSPLRERDDIDNAINTLLVQKADSVFSVFGFRKFIWGVEGGKIKSINFDSAEDRWREQDFPPQYQENGSIYAFKPEVFRRYKKRIAGKVAIYEMSELNSIQIDTNDDLILCEAIIKKNNE